VLTHTRRFANDLPQEQLWCDLAAFYFIFLRVIFFLRKISDLSFCGYNITPRCCVAV
jgi:hypothetical protein